MLPPLRPLISIVAALPLATSLACKVADPPAITAEWSDDFEREQLGGNYFPSGGNYQLASGALGTKGGENHPLWLRKKLPRNVRIELDCWSNSAAGDIKVEVFGDGRSHATDRGQYTSTGYSLVMGGWNNTKSILAHGIEHGSTMASRQTPRVEVGKRYHWKIIRHGATIDWFVDDMNEPFLRYDDPAPFAGPGHEYFGFSNWESDAWFDNLLISPL